MDDREIISEFLVESRENLDQLDQDFVVLETNPRDRERLASVFRTIHTIKGTCGFFGFDKLQTLTHAGESLLSRLRDGHLQLNPGITSGLLALVDCIRRMLGAIEATGQEGAEECTELIATLSRLKGGSLILPPEKPRPAAPVPEPPTLIQEAPIEPVKAPAPSAGDMSGDGHQEVAAVEIQAASPGEGNIRVDVGLLDKLMNLVGELVLARNQIVQHSARHEDNALTGMVQRLDQIATELQEGVMKTRMQPIGNLWNKFPRIARDLALACGKQVRLILDGAETELDKTILEAIKDPLTHLLRNAIDHGLETPEARRARDKPAEGRLVLRAFHEGGQVNIEISDDGAGINVERIKRKAIEKALLTRADAARLSDRQALDLIFLPGFSTAERVTSVSGRGVGMDVVKTNIERIGGTLDIQSRPGQGTIIKIKIPLTLAIIPVLLVRCGAERFAIPQVSVLELVRLEAGDGSRGIEWIQEAPVYRLRGDLLPLVDLARELSLESRHGARAKAAVNLVVLQADNRRFGLIVDRVNDTEEIVVKSLGELLRGMPLYAGATILGDGKVVLILDVLGLAQRAHVVTEARTQMPFRQEINPAGEQDTQTKFLICELAGGRRIGLPLSQLTRLEEFAGAAVESAAGREVIQYGGQVLPLLRLTDVLPTASEKLPTTNDRLRVAVFGAQGGRVGLVVDRIVDTVETSAELAPDARSPGLLGSAIIQNRVTDLLDVPGILRGLTQDASIPVCGGV